MKVRHAILGLAALLVILSTGPQHAMAQFTQGPPGNPSAAGIITGTQPPAPVPPHVVAPPSSSAPANVPVPQRGYLPYPAFDACPLDAGMIISPHWLLSPQGMPNAIDSSITVLSRRLNLTSTQASGISDLRDRFYRETRELRYELLRKRTELRQLLSDPKADEKTLLQRQREISSLWQRLSDLLGRAVIDARRLLTPEQIERLDQLPMQ